MRESEIEREGGREEVVSSWRTSRFEMARVCFHTHVHLIDFSTFQALTNNSCMSLDHSIERLIWSISRNINLTSISEIKS